MFFRCLTFVAVTGTDHDVKDLVIPPICAAVYFTQFL